MKKLAELSATAKVHYEAREFQRAANILNEARADHTDTLADEYGDLVAEDGPHPGGDLRLDQGGDGAIVVSVCNPISGEAVKQYPVK
jgi:hypothetical protein